MKKLAIVLFSIGILIYANTAFAAIAHVQTPSGGANCGTVTNCNLAFGSNTTAGNFIGVQWRYATGGATVTISGCSNTYTSNAIQNVDAADSNSTVGIGYAMNITGGACTANFSTGAASNIKRWTVSEFSGAATTNALDKTAQANGNSGSIAAGSVTPTTDGQLFLAYTHVAGGGTFTAGTDFTLTTTVPTTAGSQRGAGIYYIQPTAAAHDFTLSISSQSWGIAGATFKAAAAAGNGTSNGYQLLFE